MSFVWEKTPTEAWAEMATQYAEAVRTAVATLVQRYAPEIEAYMKLEALWTDRTGNARQTLYTEVEGVVSEFVELILSHGVEYGVNLELDYGGRYAIIGPSLDLFAPRIWNDVVELMRE